MKSIFSIPLFSLMLVGFVHGQSKTNPQIVKGDKFFQNAEYFVASFEYQKAYASDTSNSYLIFQLAECYRYLYDYKNAEPLYARILSKNKASYPVARFWYASILKDNGEFDAAIKNFENFQIETKENSDFELELYKEKAKQEIIDCTNLNEEEKKEVSNSHNFRRLAAPLNSPSIEFAPVIGTNDTMLLVTSSKTHGGNTGPEGNTDVHRFTKNADSSWSPMHAGHQDKFSKLNTHYSESAGSFTGDFKKYYFTRCDEQIVLDNHREFNCAVYVSYFENGAWGSAKRLNDNINSPGQWNAQPSVSPDGSFLFFVSKRPGGAGMHDIWFSTCNADDQWLPPQNLYGVNTMYMDVSPKFVPNENVLFFSSNGMGGYGGLDVFVSKAEDRFSRVYHLKKPFNSNRDDFFFTPGKITGYLSSNRKGGLGNDDIYRFDFGKPLSEFIAEIINETK